VGEVPTQEWPKWGHDWEGVHYWMLAWTTLEKSPKKVQYEKTDCGEDVGCNP